MVMFRVGGWHIRGDNKLQQLKVIARSGPGLYIVGEIAPDPRTLRSGSLSLPKPREAVGAGRSGGSVGFEEEEEEVGVGGSASGLLLGASCGSAFGQRVRPGLTSHRESWGRVRFGQIV